MVLDAENDSIKIPPVFIFKLWVKTDMFILDEPTAAVKQLPGQVTRSQKALSLLREFQKNNYPKTRQDSLKGNRSAPRCLRQAQAAYRCLSLSKAWGSE